MNLKNYTSEVPASRSIDRIEKLLVEMEATHVTKKFNKGICMGIFFQIRVDGALIPFQLPANVDACYEYLMKQRKQTNEGVKKTAREQAQRTAWKTIAEWVEIQITMILMEQAKPLQVFLPYVYDTTKDQTFYEHVTESNLKLLTQ